VGLNNKFCIKDCIESKPHCGINCHGQKLDVTPDTAFIRASDNQVLCAPTADLTTFTVAQRAKLFSASTSASDWEVCLQSIQLGDLPDWLLAEEGTKDGVKEDDVHSVQLLSLVAIKEKHGVFQLVPTFSFESEVTEDDKVKGDILTSISTEGHVKKMEDKLVVLKEKLSCPFLDIDASYEVLTSDLVKLHNKVKHVTGVIGAYHSSEMVSHWMDSFAQ